jgi:hypothetical protein
MKIDFKQPKYMLPVILLPFLCLLFYAWQRSFKPGQKVVEPTGLNGTVGQVSSGVRKKQLADKLDAYRNTYKEADGQTAVNAIPGDSSFVPAYHNDYSSQQKRKLDALQVAVKQRLAATPAARQIYPAQPAGDEAMARAVSAMARHQSNPAPAAVHGSTAREKDPMEVFKQQMAIMDSINKQNDPAYKEEQKKQQAAEKAQQLQLSEVKLTVEKADGPSQDFNTVLPARKSAFISSRLRLKLLEDIRAGNNRIPKGTYLYAQVSGFSEQRVTLAIRSILYDGKILPVKLDVYDLDGLSGLYVPSSAFRDFTKDLGGNAVQGVTLDGGSGNSQFMMSSLSKMFQSTSSAIAELIRKNKAKLKYNSYLYLIDTDALQNAQKAY